MKIFQMKIQKNIQNNMKVNLDYGVIKMFKKIITGILAFSFLLTIGCKNDEIEQENLELNPTEIATSGVFVPKREIEDVKQMPTDYDGESAYYNYFGYLFPFTRLSLRTVEMNDVGYVYQCYNNAYCYAISSPATFGDNQTLKTLDGIVDKCYNATFDCITSGEFVNYPISNDKNDTKITFESEEKLTIGEIECVKARGTVVDNYNQTYLFVTGYYFLTEVYEESYPMFVVCAERYTDANASKGTSTVEWFTEQMLQNTKKHSYNKAKIYEKDEFNTTSELKDIITNDRLLTVKYPSSFANIKNRITSFERLFMTDGSILISSSPTSSVVDENNISNKQLEEEMNRTNLPANDMLAFPSKIVDIDTAEKVRVGNKECIKITGVLSVHDGGDTSLIIGSFDFIGYYHEKQNEEYKAFTYGVSYSEEGHEPPVIKKQQIDMRYVDDCIKKLIEQTEAN